MKKDDVLINDTLWTNTGRGKVQVKVKQRIEGDRKGARVKFRVENLSTGKTLLRDPAALHKTRNFLEGRLPAKDPSAPHSGYDVTADESLCFVCMSNPCTGAYTTCKRNR